MAIVIDLIIVLIIVLSTFLGYKKGLAKVILGIFSFIIAVIISIALFKPVSNYIIDKTQIDETIKEAVINIVKEDVEESGEVKDNSNLPQAMVDYINESIENAANEVKNNAVQVAAEKISTISINIISAIVLFVVTRIILLILSLLLNKITELPIIKQFDKTGGIIYGLLKSFIIIFVVLALISFLSPLIEQTGIVMAINKSFIAGMLYNNNLLLKLIF